MGKRTDVSDDDIPAWMTNHAGDAEDDDNPKKKLKHHHRKSSDSNSPKGHNHHHHHHHHHHHKDSRKDSRKDHKHSHHHHHGHHSHKGTSSSSPMQSPKKATLPAEFPDVPHRLSAANTPVTGPASSSSVASSSISSPRNDARKYLAVSPMSGPTSPRFVGPSMPPDYEAKIRGSSCEASSTMVPPALAI